MKLGEIFIYNEVSYGNAEDLKGGIDGLKIFKGSCVILGLR